MEAGKKLKHPPAWSRFFRRLVRPFLTKAEKVRIAQVIEEMERKTTGEIHVHIIGRVRRKDILEIARDKFLELGMDKTDARNAVLILISHLDHRFAVWGDNGIHGRAGQDLWDRAKKVLSDHFGRRRYPEGIEACVREVGRELAVHFPKKGRDPGKNQIPNEVTES